MKPLRDASTGIAVAACVVACAASPAAPDVPRDVAHLPIAPYAEHEACIDGAPGERLDYRWQASEPVDFTIRYREGGAMVAPVVREGSRGDSGLLELRLRERYCVHWQAGPAGAVVDYRFVLKPPVP
ncbi:MAG TPA: hypothetical protein VFS06_17430 [Casimicrobiaceae bacterium]|nr:hypothetical protein [Casimicrobiaceae bacterium]HWD15951.1 hypothetical protein [Casimicrobiaceae bacterium]